MWGGVWGGVWGGEMRHIVTLIVPQDAPVGWGIVL